MRINFHKRGGGHVVLRPRRPPTLSLKLQAMEVVEGNKVEEEEMEEENLKGVAKL